MEDITFQLGDVYWILGFIAVIWGAVKIFREVVKPYKDMQTKVDKNINDMIIAKREIDNARSNDQAILKCLVAMLDHMITGNGIDNLKSIKRELSEYIIMTKEDRHD